MIMKQKKEKKLILFNGRWGTRQHIYLAAYNVTDACRICDEVAGYSGSWRREINEYFRKAWGKTMEGIKPERGAWVSEEGYKEKPKRVL